MGIKGLTTLDPEGGYVFSLLSKFFQLPVKTFSFLPLIKSKQFFLSSSNSYKLIHFSPFYFNLIPNTSILSSGDVPSSHYTDTAR